MIALSFDRTGLLAGLRRGGWLTGTPHSQETTVVGAGMWAQVWKRGCQVGSEGDWDRERWGRTPGGEPGQPEWCCVVFTCGKLWLLKQAGAEVFCWVYFEFDVVGGRMSESGSGHWLRLGVLSGDISKHVAFAA